MPTEDAIMTRVGDYITAAATPGVTVVQGQENRVPPPDADNYVCFWHSARFRLATNSSTYDVNGGVRAITTPMHLVVQVDVHGAQSADEAQRIYSLWRDPFGCDFMAGVADPLFCDDPQQLPFWDGENQTENRWVIKLHLQANMTVSTPQDFADTLTAELVEVDTTYPPGAP